MTSTEPRIDPALAALADAILIPPFPGTTPPAWIRRALERGLAGVTLFGPNIAGPEQVTALTEELRASRKASAVPEDKPRRSPPSDREPSSRTRWRRR